MDSVSLYRLADTLQAGIRYDEFTGKLTSKGSFKFGNVKLPYRMRIVGWTESKKSHAVLVHVRGDLYLIYTHTTRGKAKTLEIHVVDGALPTKDSVHYKYWAANHKHPAKKMINSYSGSIISTYRLDPLKHKWDKQ